MGGVDSYGVLWWYRQPRANQTDLVSPVWPVEGHFSPTNPPFFFSQIFRPSAMASTGFHRSSDSASLHSTANEKPPIDETPIARGVKDEEDGGAVRYGSSDEDESKPLYDSTHRKLKPRHIQLIGIGGFVDVLLALVIAIFGGAMLMFTMGDQDNWDGAFCANW